MRRISFFVLLFVFFFYFESFAVGPPDPPTNLRITGFPHDFSVPRTASRTTGVAPLSVHFTAGFSDSSPTERGFHNYEYSWNFGDPSNGIWGTSKKPKNEAKGPVAAHVFETPGSYTVTLTVRDATGVVDTDTFNITVTDPDTVYSGTNTTCVCDTTQNDFTGCPSGARQVSSDNISLITNYIGPGKRVLLHRGSSWTSSGLNMPDNEGPVTIGAYGICSNPDELGICSNTPQITLTGVFCDLSNKQDWRFCDISFSGAKGVQGVLAGVTDVQRILALRIKASGLDGHLGLSHWKETVDDLIDHFMIVSCYLYDANNNSVYIGAERLALLGNKIDKVSDSHVVRVWQGYLGVISHNFISGSSIDTNTGRHALKFHGPGEEEVCPTGTGTCLNHRTKFAVISDNVFGSSGPWTVAIGPADSGHNCHVSDVIFEKNRAHPDYGSQSCCSSPVQIGVSIWSRYVTLRNNIIDGTGGYNGFVGIGISQRGVEPAPVGVELYNNTFYRQDEGGITAPHVGIRIGNSATDTIVRNNFGRFPTADGNAIISDSSADLVQSNNIFTSTPRLVNPDLANPLSRDYTPQTYSPVDEAGTPDVPVLDDYFDKRRLQDNAYDIGAIEN